VVSLSHTSVAHTVLIASAAPILTTVLAWFVLREKLLMRTWLAGGFVAIGVAGIALSQPGRSELIGDLSAVVAAMSLSLVFIIQRFFRGVRQFAPMSLAGAASAVAALPFVENAALGLRNASLAWLDAAIALPLAIALITSYPDRIGASETSLLLLVETVLSPLWVWWVIRENPSEQTLVCGVLIVAALAAHSALQVRDELRPLDSRAGA
jgi:drug/metabolite transporter (DMT)-like permease